MTRQLVQNIFSDRSSLILRGMLEEPDRKWTTLDFAKRGVSKGFASEVLAKAESLGYVERVQKGPGSYSRLIRKEKLLKDWTSQYSFEKNLQTFYFYPKPDLLKVCVRYLEDKKIAYALTLFSASRLIETYVKDERHFLYLDLERDHFASFLKEMEIQTGLLKLVQGGNVCFAMPFYRGSVFRDSRKIKGYRAVSDLQLYLDLMGFPPSGPEEAEHLVSLYKREGGAFVGS
ncbi:MAG: type IV toxin-antitoxin system AbiEi family antitoxin [Candidatus Omnitrophota bacterium]